MYNVCVKSCLCYKKLQNRFTVYGNHEIKIKKIYNSKNICEEMFDEQFFLESHTHKRRTHFSYHCTR